MFFFISVVEGFRGFHIEELIEITPSALIDNFMGDKGRFSVRFGIEGKKGVIVCIINIENDEKEILSDLGKFEISLKRDFADEFLFTNVIDFNLSCIGIFFEESEDIPIAVDSNRIFDVIDFECFFVLLSLFNVVDSDQLLRRVGIETDYFYGKFYLTLCRCFRCMVLLRLCYLASSFRASTIFIG